MKRNIRYLTPLMAALVFGGAVGTGRRPAPTDWWPG
jgi:ABC-type transporter Mla maintaining outer membrane lipid asymmetry permease subunit MlaE